MPESDKNKDTKVERFHFGCGVHSNVDARLAMGRARIALANSRVKKALAKRRLSEDTH